MARHLCNTSNVYQTPSLLCNSNNLPCSEFNHFSQSWKMEGISANWCNPYTPYGFSSINLFYLHLKLVTVVSFAPIKNLISVKEMVLNINWIKNITPFFEIFFLFWMNESLWREIGGALLLDFKGST